MNAKMCFGGKVSKEVQSFLSDLRMGRKIIIGTIDLNTTRRNHKRLKIHTNLFKTNHEDYI